MPRSVAAGLLGVIDRRLSIRLVAMLLAGIGFAVLAHSTVQALAPTTEEPAVVSSLDMHPYCNDSGRRGPCRLASFEYTLRAVTSTGETLEMPARYSFGTVGLPIRIVRSAAGDQVVAVRSPVGTVDVRTEAGAIVRNLLAGLVAVAGLWLGVRGGRRRPVPPAAALATGALIGTAYMFGLVSGAVPPEVAPSAMQGYADPPTREWGLRIDSVVGPGTEVTDGWHSTLAVSGPPRSGPPPGADLALPGFDIITIPIRSTPGEMVTRLKFDVGELPDVELLGDGVGSPERVYVADRHLAYSSGVLPKVFAHGEAPARSYICFAVAPGFTPRYLVVPTAKVAIDLR